MLVALAATAQARPVSFVGSRMPMLAAQPMMVGTSVDFTPTRWLSSGLGYTWMHRRDGDVQYANAELNLLLHRWNLDDAQANAYLLTTAGALWRPESLVDPAGSVGLELDAETRTLYGLVQGRYLRSLGGYDDTQVLARFGAAPFTSEYDELNVWIILQYQWMPRFHTQHVVTPMVRLMFKSLLLEFGSSVHGEWLFNFTSEL
jgi:hypothetical protein